MLERIRTTWSTSGLTADGWTGVTNEAPRWTATVVATWRPPTIDWASLAGVVGIAVFLLVGAFLARDRGGLALVLMGLGAYFAFDAVRRLRARRPGSDLTLVLGPEALEFHSTEPGTRAVRIRRDRAGWLVATEMQADRHVRFIQLTDADDQAVAQFVGSLATVEVRDRGVPPATILPTVVPVAVLLGQWWPSPARRVSRMGSAGLRFRWREPDLDGFPRHERRERLKWSVLYGVFAIGFLWVAVAGSSPEWLRVLFGLAGAGLVAWRIHVHRWRPTYLQGF